MRAGFFLLVVGLASPTFAQDFEFDETELVFEIDQIDDFSDIEELEEAIEFDDASFEVETTSSLALTARYRYSRSNTPNQQLRYRVLSLISKTLLTGEAWEISRKVQLAPKITMG